jgi:hypothetical protein
VNFEQRAPAAGEYSKIDVSNWPRQNDVVSAEDAVRKKSVFEEGVEVRCDPYW